MIIKEKWNIISNSLLKKLGIGESYLCDMISDMLFTNELDINSKAPIFETFLEHVSDNRGYGYEAGHTISMPSDAPQFDFDAEPDSVTGRYPICHPEGSVLITTQYIYDGDPDAIINLGNFLFIIKIASVLYGQYINNKFDYLYLLAKLDRLLDDYRKML